MVDQGWTGIAVPEDAGGVGLGWVEVAVLAEAVGAHVAPAPIVQSMIAVDALRDTPWVDAVAGRRCDRVRRGVGASRGRAVRARRPTSRCAGAVTSSSSRTCAQQRPAREPAMDVTREVGWLDPDVAASTRNRSAVATRCSGSSTAVRRRTPPSCSAPRSTCSTSRPSTRRSGCSSTGRSAASRP